jgi:beta-lactamase regulating signal transducer with metallopeptidase domain
MSAGNLGMWGEPLLALAVGGAVVTALAMLAMRWTRTGAARRAVWQAAFVGLALIFAAEITGLSPGVRDWFPSDDESVIERAEWVDPVPRSTPVVVRSNHTSPTIVEKHEDNETFAESNAAESEDALSTWWPGAIWLAGVLLIAGRACVSHVLLLIYRFRRVRLQNPELVALTAEVAARLGYRRTVHIVEAGKLISPAAFGLFRPTLALPAGFSTEFTRAQQEAMLAHELAHLAAHDPAWHFFARLTTAVFWWHPLVWWAQVQFRAAAERAADEASLLVPDGPGVLATCLVQLGSRLVRQRPLGWLSMAGGGFRSGLGRRVERLLCLERGKGRPPGKRRLGAILILGSVLLVAASALSTAWARSPAASEGDVPMNNAWKRSLAATVLVAVLGSAELPGGQQSDQPKSDGRTKLLEQGRSDPRAAARQPAEIQESAAKLSEALTALGAQREELKKKIEDKKDDKDLEAIKAQLRELEAKQKDLEAMRMKLQEDLKAAAQDKTKQDKQPARIKVYRLKHRDPNEVSSVLTDLLPQPVQPAGGGETLPGGAHGFSGAAGMIGGGKAGAKQQKGMMGGGGHPMGAGMGGGMGALGMGGGFGGLAGMGGGLGGFGGAAGFGGGFGGRPTGAAQGAAWRIAVDERTNSLIVRGSEADLRTIGEIVAAVDVTDTKSSATKLKNLRTFKLKHAGVQIVSQIVQDLELNVRVSVLPSAEMLVVSGGESALKEVADLIAELDVEGKDKVDDNPKKDVKKPKQ